MALNILLGSDLDNDHKSHVGLKKNSVDIYSFGLSLFDCTPASTYHPTVWPPLPLPAFQRRLINDARSRWELAP